MFKKNILTLVLFLSVIIPTQSSAFLITKKENVLIRDSFQLEPTKIEFGMSEGDIATGTIKITNESSESADFLIELSDKDGQTSFSKNSSVDNNNFTLLSGEQAEIILTIKVPEKTDKKDFSGIVFLSSQKTKDAHNTTGAKILARTGTVVFVKYIKNSSDKDFFYFNIILFILLIVFFFLKWKRK